MSQSAMSEVMQRVPGSDIVVAALSQARARLVGEPLRVLFEASAQVDQAAGRTPCRPAPAHCGPGTEWIRFTKKKVPPKEGAYFARDDECTLSPLISLPGRKNIGIARHWHAIATRRAPAASPVPGPSRSPPD